MRLRKIISVTDIHSSQMWLILMNSKSNYIYGHVFELVIGRSASRDLIPHQ